jgi:tRNA threonylcarbamoyladenosine biosynthesis protein TsaE
MLRPGDLVLLRGELGVGKTTLVRAVARELGVAGPVTSPTFTVAQRHRGREVEVAHMDAYRLDGPDAEEAELLADAVGGDAVAFVEWPDAVLEALPEPRLEIALRHGGGDRRLVLFTARDARDRDLLGRQLADLRARHLNCEPEPGARSG